MHYISISDVILYFIIAQYLLCLNYVNIVKLCSLVPVTICTGLCNKYYSRAGQYCHFDIGSINQDLNFNYLSFVLLISSLLLSLSFLFPSLSALLNAFPSAHSRFFCSFSIKHIRCSSL